MHESSPPINQKVDKEWFRAPKSIRIQLETKGASGVEGKGEVLLQLQKGGGFVGGDNNTDTLNTHTHCNSYGDPCSDLFSGDIDPKLESARDQVRAFYLRRHSPPHS